MFIGAVIVSCSDSIDNENFKDNSISPKENVDESKSLEVFNELSNTFVNYIRTTDEDKVYPTYYSGAYINENGVLTVLVTNKSEKNIKDLHQRAKRKHLTYKNANIL